MRKHTRTPTTKQRPAFHWTLLFAAISATSCFAGEDNLSELALEDLLKISVSSVSRYDQPTTEAPASIIPSSTNTNCAIMATVTLPRPFPPSPASTPAVTEATPTWAFAVSTALGITAPDCCY